MKRETGICSLCQRHSHLTFHHLIPRKLHRRKYFKTHYSKEELNRGVLLCRQCHFSIHKFYDEMSLAKRFNSLEKLQQDESIKRHVAWVAKQNQAC